MLQKVAVIELMLCWFAWALGFVGARKKASGQKKTVRARASWLGFFLQAIGFSLVWAYVRPAGFEKSAFSLIASMIIAPLSAALAWSAVRHLGKQWRYEAALNQDPIPLGSASDLPLDVGYVSGHGSRMDLVAAVGCGVHPISGRHRDSHAGRRPFAGRTIQGVFHGISLSRPRLYPVDSLMTRRQALFHLVPACTISCTRSLTDHLLPPMM